MSPANFICTGTGSSPKKREQIVFTRKITINYLHLHCSQLVNTSMPVLKNVH